MLIATLCIAGIVAAWCVLIKVADWIILMLESDDEEIGDDWEGR